LALISLVPYAYFCHMAIEISLLVPDAILLGIEYFESNYPGETNEIDVNLLFFRITFMW